MPKTTNAPRQISRKLHPLDGAPHDKETMKRPRKPSCAKWLKNNWPAFYEWKKTAPALLALPMPPNMANSRMHWRAKETARQEYFNQCDTLRSHGLIPSPPATPAQRVQVAGELCLKMAMDYDGATARIKWPLDWLVRNGYLLDDKPANCDLLMPAQRSAKGTVQRIAFVISEVAAL